MPPCSSMRLVASHSHVDARNQRLYCVASLQEQEQEQEQEQDKGGVIQSGTKKRRFVRRG